MKIGSIGSIGLKVSCRNFFHANSRIRFYESMVQSSLLLNAGIPDNPEALQNWVERVRSRISMISKQISSLDNEKRTLLHKLQEAGLSTISIETLEDQLPSHTSVAKENHSSPSSCMKDAYPDDSVLVVDLVESSQSVNGDLNREHSLQPNQSACSDTETEFCADVQDSVLDNFDPHELSFELSQGVLTENEPPSNELPRSNPSCRVFRVSEFSEIDWMTVSSSELKQWLQFFGMKPALGGRKVMVDKLREIFNYLSSNGEQNIAIEPPPAVRKDSTKTILFSQFRNGIISNTQLHEKIVCFETIDVGDVFEYLRESIQEHSFSIKHVKEYLDQIHVQYCTTSEKFSKKARPNPPQPKKPRAVRKSISCPM